VRSPSLFFAYALRGSEGDKLGRNSADAICINEATNNGARSMNYVPAIEQEIEIVHRRSTEKEKLYSRNENFILKVGSAPISYFRTSREMP
jgi:hypothetical protein